MPPAFAGPSSIAASDSLYGVRSAPCCAGKSPTSTLNAAAATAASFENDGSAWGATRYGCRPPSIALTASYTAPWTIARLSTATCGACPAPAGAGDMIEVDAIRFHLVAAFSTDCPCAGTESAPTARAAVIRAVTRRRETGAFGRPSHLRRGNCWTRMMFSSTLATGIRPDQTEARRAWRAVVPCRQVRGQGASPPSRGVLAQWRLGRPRRRRSSTGCAPRSSACAPLAGDSPRSTTPSAAGSSVSYTRACSSTWSRLRPTSRSPPG